MPPSVRHADPALHSAACAAIYAPHVADGYASFEVGPPSAEEMAARMVSASASHAWLVSEIGTEVVGLAWAGPHHPREGYRWAANVAVYVHPEHHRQGVGRTLYGALFGLLARQRLRWAMAAIALPNPASVELHRACGFGLAAVYHDIGYKAGAWHDVSWWQRELAPPEGDPPPEPLGPQRLPVL